MNTHPQSPGKLRLYLVPTLSILLCLVSAFAIFALIKGNTTHLESTKEVEQTKELHTQVIKQTLTQTYRADVKVTQENQQEINSVANGIVTGESAAIGTDLHSGDILTTINERPLFIFSGKTPAYRDLKRGDRGEDVAQIQRTLQSLGYSISDPVGEYGKTTAYSIYRFYINSGYYPPGDTDRAEDEEAKYDTSFPLNEYYFVNADHFVVDSECGKIGKNATAPLCTVSQGEKGFSIVSDGTPESKLVQSGQEVIITNNSGEEFKGKIGDVQIKQEGTPEEHQEYAIVLEDTQNFEISQNLTARVIIGTSAEDALTVAETAIRTEANGKMWVQNISGEKIPLEIGYCANGYCEITNADSSLNENTTLTIP